MHEAAWVPIAFLRHDFLQCAKGRLSAVMRLLVRRMFYERRELANGVVVDGVGEGGAPALLFFSDWETCFTTSPLAISLSAQKAHPGCSLAYVARTFMAA